jgi:hypothetical protein
MRILCVLALSFFLVACGSGDEDDLAGVSSGGTTVTAQQSPIAPLSVPAPPGAGERPLKPGESGTVYMPNGLPALKSQGLKTDFLFSEKLSSPDARFDRLETTVLDMRKEFDAVKPAIIRLSAVEEDMQILLRQLETLVQTPLPEQDTEPAPPTSLQNAAELESKAPAEPEHEIEIAPAISPVKDVQTLIKGTVRNFRIGEHTGMTRLVIDLGCATPFRHDLDNAEKLLLIELPECGWSAAAQGTTPQSPLMESWNTQPLETGKGTRIIIRLRKNITVAQAVMLTSPDRIMLDLKRL